MSLVLARLVLLNRAALAAFVVTLAFTAYVAAETVARVASRYYLVGFQEFYGFEYADVLRTLSLAVGGPVPIVGRGYTAEHVFAVLVREMNEKYAVVNKWYAWVVLRDAGTWFYSVSLPLAMLFTSVFYTVVLDAIAVPRALQVAASVGVRRYYTVVAGSAVATGLLYSLVLVMPLAAYVCPVCGSPAKLVGLLSVAMLLAALLLVEAFVYAASGWNPLSALLVGVAASMVALSRPDLVVGFAQASRSLFGFSIEADALASLGLQAVLLALVGLAAYAAAARRELY